MSTWVMAAAMLLPFAGCVAASVFVRMVRRRARKRAGLRLAADAYHPDVVRMARVRAMTAPPDRRSAPRPSMPAVRPARQPMGREAGEIPPGLIWTDVEGMPGPAPAMSPPSPAYDSGSSGGSDAGGNPA